MKSKEKVVLGMSGGTDSSAAALFLQHEGYEVIGVTFRFYEPEGDTSYLDDARDTAHILGIKHQIFDVRREFEEKIISYFINEYMVGRTPVPCIVCNNSFKWPLLARIAEEKGIFYIATGHYVRNKLYNNSNYIYTGLDKDKDQSFFLWGLGPDLLKRALFPLGRFTKSQVREFVRQQGLLKMADKKDSLGVCFCPGDYRSFLRNRVPKSSFNVGFYEDVSGHVLGKHEGYPFYTIGQRRGLGINLQVPMYVQAIIPGKNRIRLSPLSGLYCNTMLLKAVNIVSREDFDNQEVICRIRYRKQSVSCRVEWLSKNQVKVFFCVPEHSIAPGQAAAFYKGDRLLGGGIIEQAL